MRLSDAGLHRRRTKAVYPHHPSPPWLTEDATRDRSNRLLGDWAIRSTLLELALAFSVCRRFYLGSGKDASVWPYQLRLNCPAL
jgi:hypothetical protein